MTRGDQAFLGILAAVAVMVPVLNLAVPAASPLHLSTYTVTLIGKYLCYATLALAVDLVWGYCGILSLGHAAFFSLGGYAMGTALERSESQTDLCVKAAAFGMATVKADGMDVVAVHEAARRACERVRAGEGPVFVEFRTYRFRAHSMFDPELYREKKEVEAWKTRGPIHTFTARLKLQGQLTEDQFLQMDRAALAEVEAAVAFAEAGTWEPVAELTRHVMAP